VFREDGLASVSFLEVAAGFRCSRHFHDMRSNQFSVIQGRIVVEEWESDGHRHEMELGPGQSYVVPSKIVHRFRVLEDGIVIEIYWSDVIGGKVLMDDIVRLDEGGPDVGEQA